MIEIAEIYGVEAIGLSPLKRFVRFVSLSITPTLYIDNPNSFERSISDRINIALKLDQPFAVNVNL